jgi:hypothetical protein
MSEKKNESKTSLKIKHVIQETIDTDLQTFIRDKISYLQEIIRDTIISVKRNNEKELFSNNDISLSISVLTELYEKTIDVSKQLKANVTSKSCDKLIDSLQKIIDKLSMIICGFGTKRIEDLLFIIFGSEFKDMKIEDAILRAKYDIIRKYVQPIGYKVVHWKTTKIHQQSTSSYCCNKITEDTITIEDANMFECFDVDPSCRSFYQKIYGIRVVIQNEKNKKTLIINGVVEDIHIECFTNEYIKSRAQQIKTVSAQYEEVEKGLILRILETATLKDILVLGIDDIKKRMISICTEVHLVNQTKLDITIKKFLDMSVFSQRDMLIHLLIYYCHLVL